MAGEVEPIGEQAINFAKAVGNTRPRGCFCGVSNRAIDNAAFDLLGFVTYKFQKGLAKLPPCHIFTLTPLS